MFCFLVLIIGIGLLVILTSFQFELTNAIIFFVGIRISIRIHSNKNKRFKIHIPIAEKASSNKFYVKVKKLKYVNLISDCVYTHYTKMEITKQFLKLQILLTINQLTMIHEVANTWNKYKIK